jgi:hypothetical protein
MARFYNPADVRCAIIITSQRGIIHMRASGTFQVKLQPQPDDHLQPLSINRLSIDKQFHGDLQAHSQGQMLSVISPVDGSAGYVAIERVTGTLAGRSGVFALQHYGVSDRGGGQLQITVVPDSATGDLTGLTGTMNIAITDGQHFYEFDYTFAS